MIRRKVYFVLALLALLSPVCGQPKRAVDPFYYPSLKEHYDTAQVDFSREWLKFCMRGPSRANQVEKLDGLNCSSIWLSGNRDQNGVLGVGYQRIRFHIDAVRKDTRDQRLYHVQGKSLVRDSAIRFFGTIRLLGSYHQNGESRQPLDESAGPLRSLFYSYRFEENKNKKATGVFSGNGQCYIDLDVKKRQAVLDTDGVDFSDGYNNRTYVGTWTNYRTRKVKKCIWGDFRLPFTFDFDRGAGEMSPNEKYRANGWMDFNNEMANGETFQWWRK